MVAGLAARLQEFTEQPIHLQSLMVEEGKKIVQLLGELSGLSIFSFFPN